MKIVIRPTRKEDHPFIFATYIRSNWFRKSQKTTLKRSTWSGLQHTRLEGILSHPGAYTACLNEDEDFILGYGFMDAGEPYTYIKLDFRAPGLKLKELLTQTVVMSQEEKK